MAEGPDDPYSRTFVGGGVLPTNPSYPNPQRPPDGASTVPIARFTPSPPVGPSGAFADTSVTSRAVAPYGPGPGGYGLPSPRAPTHPPGAQSALPPAAPPQTTPSLTPLYNGLPVSQSLLPQPAPRVGHRRALLWLAVTTTTLAVALFAASILVHVRRRTSDHAVTRQPTRMEAPRETVGVALIPAAPPTPTPSEATPVAATAPLAVDAPTEATPPHGDSVGRRGHNRRHPRTPVRRHRRTDTPLWGVP